MSLNNAVMAMSGFLVMLSLLLGASISPLIQHQNWLYLTAFVGLMTFQSSFTGFCPAAIILKKLGFK